MGKTWLLGLLGLNGAMVISLTVGCEVGSNLIGAFVYPNDGSPSGDLDSQIEAVLNPKYGVDFADRCKKFFENRSRAELRVLKSHPCAGIALGAGWEQVRRSVPKTELFHAMNVDEKHLQNFLDLVTNRLGVVPPVWWKEAVLRSRAYSRSTISFDIDEKWWYKPGPTGFWLPPETTLEKRPDGIVLFVGGQQAGVLPESLMETQEGRPEPSLSAAFDERRAYVAIHSDVRAP